MKEQLISFETAKLAKEKGFNEYCEYFYCDGSQNLEKSKEKVNRNSNFDKPCTAATQSLLQKWLREVHDIHVETFKQMGINSTDVFYVSVIQLHNKKKDSSIPSRKYEEALEAGLQEALKLIK